MEYGVKSDVGQVRPNNQDSYIFRSGDLPVFAVADGMGGHQAGEVASAMAIEVIRQYEIESEDMRQVLQDIIHKANEFILQRQAEDIDCQGMGTTITMGILQDHLLYVGHVGDSRAYLFRNGEELLQITTDHSLVNELLQNKQITEEEAENHPQKHILLQALGTEESLDIEINCISLEKSDIILLCTDGLTNMLTDDEIALFLQADATLQEKADALVEVSNAKGGRDNITVVLVQPMA